jgi:hypothetical protein
VNLDRQWRYDDRGTPTARKQRLVERLHENPGPNERAEIERLLAQVDAALDLLEEVGPGRERR